MEAGYTGSASANFSSVHASPSSIACASISSSLSRGRAAKSANSLALSMSARLRCTIGIPFLPLHIPQADASEHFSALDSMQCSITFPIFAFVVTLDNRTVELKSAGQPRPVTNAFTQALAGC
jgi:hypothetical protein